MNFLINAAFFGWPFVKRFALCYQTVVCPVLSVCNVGVLWPSGWMDQDETWHAGTPRPWPHCARWRPSSLPKKGAEPPPQFSAHFYCGQTAGCIKMLLGKLVWCWSQPRRLCVRLRPSPPKKGAEPPLLPSSNFWPLFIVAKRLHASRCHLVRR